MIYDSDKRMNPAIEEIVNAFRYKDLITHLIRRDITTRYKRSVLGVIWTMLNPLGVMIILTFVFQDFFHRQEAFPVYLLSGLLAFNFFSQTSTAIIKNLIWGEDLFQRIYIPRSSFAIAAVGTALVNLLLAFVPLILVKIAIGSQLSWHILFVPIHMVFLASFSLGVGLIIASMALYFHDIAEIYQVILTGWFYATPIIYPYDGLPESVRNILAINPMLYIVNLMRDAFYGDLATFQCDLFLAAVISSAVLVIGWFLFSRQTEEFVLRG